MTDTKPKTVIHPGDTELAGYMDNTISAEKRHVIEKHLAGCPECLIKAVASYDSVKIFKSKERIHPMKKFNIYLTLAVIAFILSFAFPKYFIQSLVATLVLGLKWIVDSKTTKMLITIYEAWKTGGEKEASRLFETMNKSSKDRF